MAVVQQLLPFLPCDLGLKAAFLDLLLQLLVLLKEPLGPHYIPSLLLQGK